MTAELLTLTADWNFETNGLIESPREIGSRAAVVAGQEGVAIVRVPGNRYVIFQRDPETGDVEAFGDPRDLRILGVGVLEKAGAA